MNDRIRRRWRFYRTPSGREPAREFLEALPEDEAKQILGAMREVEVGGRSAARHLRGEIYEVRAPGDRVTYRILFSTEGRRRHILLALEAFTKKTQKTPRRAISLAEQRLADWRRRGRR